MSWASQAAAGASRMVKRNKKALLAGVAIAGATALTGGVGAAAAAVATRGKKAVDAVLQSAKTTAAGELQQAAIEAGDTVGERVAAAGGSRLASRVFAPLVGDVKRQVWIAGAVVLVVVALAVLYARRRGAA